MTDLALLVPFDHAAVTRRDLVNRSGDLVVGCASLDPALDHVPHLAECRDGVLCIAVLHELQTDDTLLIADAWPSSQTVEPVRHPRESAN